jgi:hypothetical protein
MSYHLPLPAHHEHADLGWTNCSGLNEMGSAKMPSAFPLHIEQNGEEVLPLATAINGSIAPHILLMLSATRPVLAFLAPAGQIYQPLLDSFQPGRLQPPVQLRREIPAHASQLAQSRSRIFRPVDIEFDELDPGAGEAEALVHEVEASLPVAGPRFGDVLRGEVRVGRELGEKELGLDVGTDVGIATVGCRCWDGGLEIAELGPLSAHTSELPFS